MTAQEIADECSKYFGWENIIFTGGEPLLQVDLELTQELIDREFVLHVETNGSIEISDELADRLWVTCSPKFKKIKLKEEHIDELKLLYNKQGLYHPHHFTDYHGLKFLQPLYGETEKETIKFVLENPEWNLSVQTHKFIGVE